MRLDGPIDETIRIGERLVPIMPTERAGHVFGPDRKPHRNHPARRPKRVLYVRDDKLHRMADWYRPKGNQ